MIFSNDDEGFYKSYLPLDHSFQTKHETDGMTYLLNHSYSIERSNVYKLLYNRLHEFFITFFDISCAFVFEKALFSTDKIVFQLPACDLNFFRGTLGQNTSY